MGLLRWIFDKDVEHYERKVHGIMSDAEQTAGRVLNDAQRTANRVVKDATRTAVQVVDNAERRLIRAYVIAFCLVVTAGLVHYGLVRSQVRALVAAEANTAMAPAHQPKKGGEKDGREEDLSQR
jgi:cell division septum initiation protein DivIVA